MRCDVRDGSKHRELACLPASCPVILAAVERASLVQLAARILRSQLLLLQLALPILRTIQGTLADTA
jgi:hypothetical protein